MENNKIAVVTGANGFVGSHLTDLLLEKGFTVRCVVRNTSDLKWLKGKKVEFYDCGLLNKVGLRKALAGASYIYHVAGVVKAKNPGGYYRGNVETTQVLLETAEEFKSTLERVLIVSSQTAAGPAKEGTMVTEEEECKPITTYGRSKLEEERISHKFMNKFPITICRPSAVYGERDTEIFIFFRTFYNGLFTTIGFDEKVLSLLHVSDLVNGFYLAATSEKSIGETYFITSEKFYTWEEVGGITSKIMNKKPLHIKVPHFLVYTIAAFAQILAKFTSKPATLNIEKAKDITQISWVCSASKAVKDLGFQQSVPLEEGIRRTFEWYKKMDWL
jgi:Nucleoside-diphosphate-sugar epimerases